MTSVAVAIAISSDDNATPYEEDIPVGVDSNDTLPLSPQHHSVSHASSSPAPCLASSSSLSTRPCQQRQHPNPHTQPDHHRPHPHNLSDSKSEPAAPVDCRTDPLDIQALSHYPPEDNYQLNLPQFQPLRQPGFYPPEDYPTDALGCFKLFFTDEMLETIRTNSNINGEDNCKKSF
ncbi:uncharacterized protein LOC134198432 [Corticium candelabrum]|uniref:uncharacterized protein LOC134198432 n=1 Tax=Corticium candelabrum TaxID=121492 RepID=UPI002E2737F6|nr:uncharacterized protein LOC134198432 [Corticium candelabrum]